MESNTGTNTDTNTGENAAQSPPGNAGLTILSSLMLMTNKCKYLSTETPPGPRREREAVDDSKLCKRKLELPLFLLSIFPTDSAGCVKDPDYILTLKPV